MAIINTYPTATPKGADLLIGTQVKDDTVLENSTKSFSVDALGSYIVTSTSGITGSGTLRQIPMFTPNGQAVGDSVMFQIPNNPWIQVGVVGVGQETVLGPGFVSTTALGVDNIIAIDGGSVTLNGNVIIGNADTDLLTVTSTSRFYNNVQLGSDTDDQIAVEGTLELQGPVKDHSANLPSSAGQILVAGTDGIVTWTDIAGISGSVTGSGTTNTIPVWTDGPNGVLGDSFITQTTSPDAVTISSRFIVSPNSILGLEVSQAAGKAVVTISDNLKVNGTYYDAASDEGTDGDLLVAKGFPGNMVSRWVDRDLVASETMTKLIPFQITALAGGSSTYSANNNIVEFSWDNVNGNGVYVLTIPSAATIPYRNIRFVTNSTFPNGASDKVEITAQAGETIDGAAFFEISKQYEGVSLWSNGTEWIVIQAKAH